MVHPPTRSDAGRLAAPDAIRALAVLGVIVIHADHWPLQNAGADAAVWSAVDQLARVAVPLFVMLSGFLLARRPVTAATWRPFLRRRLGRSILPWLVWVPVYAVVGMTFTAEIQPGWPGLAAWLALGGGHLWFLLLIPQLYVVFLAWPRRLPGQVVATIAALAVQVALDAYRLYAPAGAPLNDLFLAHGFQLAPFWIGWFALGALLATLWQRGRRPWPVWPFALALPLTAALLILSPVGEFAQGTGAFLRPELAPFAVATFCALALGADRLLAGRPALARATTTISRYSLGIYVVHEALLYIPGRLLAIPLLQQHVPLSALGVALLAGSTFAIALAAARLIAATPLAPALGVERYSPATDAVPLNVLTEGSWSSPAPGVPKDSRNQEEITCQRSTSWSARAGERPPSQARRPR